MREAGIAESEIKQALDGMASTDVLLWSCNVSTWNVFCGMSNDFVCDVSPDGRRMFRGFNSVAIRAAFDLAAIAPDEWPDLAGDIRQMGRAAAEELNKRKN